MNEKSKQKKVLGDNMGQMSTKMNKYRELMMSLTQPIDMLNWLDVCHVLERSPFGVAAVTNQLYFCLFKVQTLLARGDKT